VNRVGLAPTMAFQQRGKSPSLSLLRKPVHSLFKKKVED
jgi:hypothetical protein